MVGLEEWVNRPSVENEGTAKRKRKDHMPVCIVIFIIFYFNHTLGHPTCGTCMDFTIYHYGDSKSP